MREIKDQTSPVEAVFTWDGITFGARQSVPFVVSTLIWGAIYGLMARQAGIQETEALLMSLLVHAGTAQMVVLGMWTMPLPVAGIILTTTLVNLRHVLFSAALQPFFHSLSRWKKYVTANFITDENWALTMREFENGNRDATILIGTGIPMNLAWIAGTWIGYRSGTIIADPAEWGLDFFVTAVFTALLISLWKGRAQLLPWLAAAAVAVLVSFILPGNWHILCGGLAGSLIGGWSDGR